LIKAEDGLLKVRNQVYERVFDEAWIRHALSELEPEKASPTEFRYDVYISYMRPGQGLGARVPAAAA